jgi:hypothetical protein
LLSSRIPPQESKKNETSAKTGNEKVREGILSNKMKIGGKSKKFAEEREKYIKVKSVERNNKTRKEKDRK